MMGPLTPAEKQCASSIKDLAYKLQPFINNKTNAANLKLATKIEDLENDVKGLSEPVEFQSPTP